MKSIVVGIDGSAGSAEALRWSVEEARLHRAHVTAVRCWGGRDHLARDDGDDRQAAAERQAQDELRDLVAATVPHDLDVVDWRTVDARPEWGLLDVASEADLLVVGARGISGIRGLLVGSVSQQVVHHAHVPVAVVRHTRLPVAPRRVVVGVDGSNASQRALEWAVTEARRRGADLEAVIAWNAPYTTSPFAPVVDVGRDLERAAREQLLQTLATVDCSELNQPAIVTVAHGPAGQVLTDAAAGAELLVVGSRGLGGFKELLLGSVGQHVAHMAPCPVIVIRPGGATP
jgi:nucleotide-binding universal stress UspA family protein